MGLKLTFLIVSRAISLLRLSRREAWWKDAEILMLRHQLAVAAQPNYVIATPSEVGNYKIADMLTGGVDVAADVETVLTW